MARRGAAGRVAAATLPPPAPTLSASWACGRSRGARVSAIDYRLEVTGTGGERRGHEDDDRFTSLEIESGDITALKVDAIVNAANDHLWMGSGVAGAIKRAGGK